LSYLTKTIAIALYKSRHNRPN